MKQRFVYRQSTGELLLDGKVLTSGYSGAPGHVNDPASEHLRSKGPIPRGLYQCGKAQAHPRLGPNSVRLIPYGHNALGRTQFYAHGDNRKGDRSASLGCIIIGPKYRLMIAGHEIEVTK